MKIFVDFDRVAWDVDRLYELLPAEGDPQPGTIESLDYIKNEHGLEVRDLLFEDFIEFVQQQIAMDNEVILVSSPSGFSREWDQEYQEEKIARSGVREMVSKVIVSSEKKGAVISDELKKGERAVYVEDNENHLENAREMLMKHGFSADEIGLYQMLRKGERRTAGGVESVEASAEFKQVKNFEQLDALLEGKKEDEE